MTEKNDAANDEKVNSSVLETVSKLEIAQI
jgi:hypothetical protein